ncbi:AgmX/PglI C-terminal domain-containing protein [Sinimarinibacterium sp. CAU 1509]|uniref:AgmX/PglI C-terminal domain-containing protein n=1 Tax=Sinimarinibacterium sp. CAU 1509 TaxID=2562283 RepID=UPI0010ACBBC4|nr:AgmX/PglI C-terminal domain-containing protein [Sinimarinibacterium sp. CAU 1509]TJY60986.1 AgmX/PglI C-terminal domain-containing protein [Sinimarinibacterium sp. CAU 1509]
MSAHAIQWQTWTLAEEADRRFRKFCLIVGIPLLILSAIVPFLELVGLTKGGGTLTGSRYVELLPEQPAPIAEKVEEPKPAEKSEPEPEEQKAAPEPKPVPKPPQPKPVVQPEVQQQRTVERARETAAKSGVMAFANQLQALHTGVAAIERSDQPLSAMSSDGGASATADSSAFEQAAASASSGIGNPNATGSTRRTQAGTGLGERRTTQVESPVGFGKDRSRPGQGGDKLIAGRTLEEIQLTFDRNKGAFYAIFNRAMRQNPNLGAGKIVVSITIAPDGSVTACKLISSSFNDAELERKIVQRVQLLNFGAKSVPPFTYPNYPINFLPS